MVWLQYTDRGPFQALCPPQRSAKIFFCVLFGLEKQIEELLQFLQSNHMGWSAQMAPAIMGNPDRPELGTELANSFCRTDPEIAKAFARVTFTSDNCEDLAKVHVPTLIL